MASPVGDTYTCASGQGIYGGKFNWPAWRRAIAAQTWGYMSVNTLRDIDPKANPAVNPNYPLSPPWNGSIGVAGVVIAYCGACYDQITDTLWLPLGGGHQDYAGNEPYRVRLNTGSPAFEMIRPPSGAIGYPAVTYNDGQEVTGLYSDGRLRAVHSYNKPVYVPGVGPVMAVTGASFPLINAPYGNNKTAVISETTGELVSYTADNTHISANVTSGSGSCYDPLRNMLWLMPSGGGKLTRRELPSGEWEDTGVYRASPGNSGLEYLPDYDCIVWFNSGLTNGFAVIDCETLTIYYPAVTGSYIGVTKPTGDAQPRYVRSAKQIAFWHNSTNTTAINTLTFTSDPRTDTWTIDQLPVSGANTVTPAVRAVQGTYGRFFYSEKLDGFGIFSGIDERIAFYARS
jgi:hypothetical protein